MRKHKTNIAATIERSEAIKHFDENLKVADGIRVARGDLGVELPIEEIANLQKQLIAKASLAGKPVIIAMLVAGPSTRYPEANHRIEFLRVDD